MRVLLAGATGEIGRPLIRGLKQHGHSVFGLVRSAESTRMLAEMDVEALIGDALDAASVWAAIARVRPDAVINELTSLPRHYTPAEMKAAAERDTNPAGEMRRSTSISRCPRKIRGRDKTPEFSQRSSNPAVSGKLTISRDAAEDFETDVRVLRTALFARIPMRPTEGLKIARSAPGIPTNSLRNGTGNHFRCSGKFQNGIREFPSEVGNSISFAQAVESRALPLAPFFEVPNP
jgi:NAD(P)H-binding